MKAGKGVTIDGHFHGIFYLNDKGCLINQDGHKVEMMLSGLEICSDDWTVAIDEPLWRVAQGYFRDNLENYDTVDIENDDLWKSTIALVLEQARVRRIVEKTQ